MADNTASYILSIQANIGTLTEQLSKVQSEVSNMATKVGESTAKAGNSFKEMTASFLSADAIKSVLMEAKNYVLDAIKEYDGIAVSMFVLTKAYGSQAEELKTLAEAKKAVTRFNDDEVLSAAKVMQTHKLSVDQIKQLIPVVMDFAAKSGKSLEGTTEAFTRAIQFGTTRGLRPYGIELEKTGSQVERFESLLTAGLNPTVKGSAEEVAKLGAGPLITMNNQMSEIKKGIGEGLIPVLVELTGIFKDKVLPQIEPTVKGFTDIVTSTPGIIAAITAIGCALTMAFIISPVGAALAAIGAGIMIVSNAMGKVKIEARNAAGAVFDGLDSVTTGNKLENLKKQKEAIDKLVNSSGGTGTERQKLFDTAGGKNGEDVVAVQRRVNAELEEGFKHLTKVNEEEKTKRDITNGKAPPLSLSSTKDKTEKGAKEEEERIKFQLGWGTKLQALQLLHVKSIDEEYEQKKKLLDLEKETALTEAKTKGAKTGDIVKVYALKEEDLEKEKSNKIKEIQLEHVSFEDELAKKKLDTLENNKNLELSKLHKEYAKKIDAAVVGSDTAIELTKEEEKKYLIINDYQKKQEQIDRDAAIAYEELQASTTRSLNEQYEAKLSILKKQREAELAASPDKTDSINLQYNNKESNLGLSKQSERTQIGINSTQNSLEMSKIYGDKEEIVRYQNDLILLQEQYEIQQARIAGKSEEEIINIHQKYAIEYEKSILDKYNNIAQEMMSIGQQIGSAIGQGIAEGGKEGLKSALTEIIDIFLSFAEKMLITTIITNTLKQIELNPTGWIGGAIVGALQATAITGLFEAAKAGIKKIKMESGGQIYGARHSGGGVDINAEGGEYIHPRSSVEYYGSSAMEAIRTKQVPRELLNSFTAGTSMSVTTHTETGGIVTKSSPTKFDITNIVDPWLIDKHLSSVRGRDSMLNFIADNSGAISNRLGLA